MRSSVPHCICLPLMHSYDTYNGKRHDHDYLFNWKVQRVCRLRYRYFVQLRAFPYGEDHYADIFWENFVTKTVASFKNLGSLKINKFVGFQRSIRDRRVADTAVKGLNFTNLV